LAAGAGVEESESAEESGEEEGDVPWWEKSKQLLEESSKNNQGNKGIEMGSMIIGVRCIIEGHVFLDVHVSLALKHACFNVCTTALKHLRIHIFNIYSTTFKH